MTECRYHGKCVTEFDTDFDICCPCIGNGADACISYEPMPDVEALLKLASRMEADANEAIYFELTMEPLDVSEYAAKIREAVGA